MSIFFLDIETKPDELLIDIFKANVKPSKTLKDPKKIEVDIEKKQANYKKSMSVDQDYCDIVCVGIKELNQKGRLYSIEDMETWFKNYEDATIVTFNGKSFDIPIIIKVGAKKDLKLPYKSLVEMTQRFKPSRHIDLMQKLAFDNFSDRKSLDTYLRIYLGTQKDTLGDEFFATATEDEIIKHCIEDLQFTEDLFKKFRFFV